MHSKSLKNLTPGHCALIHRPLLNSPIGLHYGFLGFIKGQWRVLHLSKQGKPELVSLELFASGKDWDIEELRVLDKDETTKRIQKALDERSTYALLSNNCEDFARYIYNGKWLSHQTIFCLVLTVLGILSI